MRRALLIILTATTTVVAAQDFGPISTRNHRAIDLPFFRFDPHAGLVPEGQREWDLSITNANDSRNLPRPGPALVVEDQETERLLVRYRKGLKGGNEVAVELPLLSRGGGFLDPIIDAWHKHVLHWEDSFRASQPYGQSIVQVPGSSFGSASGVGDASFAITQKVNRRLEVGAGVKLPTGDGHRLLGSGGLDGGLVAKYRQALKRKWSFYAMAAVVAQSPSDALQSVRGLIDQESLALAWQPNSRDNWVVQWQSEASPITTGVSGSDASQRLVTLGYQRKLGEGRMLELSFSEDRDLFSGTWPEGANIGPDFTIHIGYRMRSRI